MISDCCGMMVRFQDICPRCGEHCVDAYDAARDCYDSAYGPAVTRQQRAEEEEERAEYRRNRW